MFDFPALDEAALEDLKEIGAARTVVQRKEAMELFYTLSCDFRDAFSELEIVVLKPLCTSCASQRTIGWTSNDPAIVTVLPGYRPQQLRIYDMANPRAAFLCV
jgi:hypothetical protein